MVLKMSTYGEWVLWWDGSEYFCEHYDMKITINLALGNEQKLKIIQLSNKGMNCNFYLVQAFRLLRRDLGEKMPWKGLFMFNENEFEKF